MNKSELRKIIREVIEDVKSSQYKEYLQVLKYLNGNNPINKKASVIKYFQNEVLGIDYKVTSAEKMIKWWLSDEQQSFIKDELK